MKGVYPHCDEAHLHRYLAEVDFRYNNRIALEIDDTGAPSTRWRALAASDSPIEGLTKPALERSARVTDEVKRAIREIL